MYAFQVEAYSHHFVVSGYNDNGHRVVREYAKRFVAVEVTRNWDGSYSRTPTEIYAVRSNDQKEYRFHINDLDNFIKCINNNGYPTSSINFKTVPMYDPVPVEMKLLPGVVLRGYQEPIVDHLCKPMISKLVELQTGQGKTLSTLAALVRQSVRAAVVIKGMYVPRWLEDLTHPDKKKIDLKTKDVIVVRGARQLIRLIELGLNNAIDAKVIIITSKTLYAFYKHYRESGGDTSLYGIAPYRLYEAIGVGVRVIDEVHQEFHFNFMQDLYTHVPTTISLSATLRSDNQFLNGIYQVMFPAWARAEVPDLIKYVSVYGVTYTLRHREKVKFLQRGKGFYSHTVFEESLMKNPDMLSNYLKLIEETLAGYYLDIWKPGAKALIFAATVQMCRLIRDHLQKSFNFNDLTICKYTSEDVYEKAIISDIIVSTIGSAGTAVDIPNLITVISSTAISKSETSIQNMGRIRECKGEFSDIVPRFVYLICTDIPKHVEYHHKKQRTFRGRALSHDTLAARTSV